MLVPITSGFEANRGQIADPTVQHVVRVRGATVLFTAEGVRVVVPSRRRKPDRPATADVVSLHVDGQLSALQSEGLRPTGAVSNYFRGQDSQRWVTEVPNYEAVRYAVLAPGVSAEFYRRDTSVEYDLEIAPHTNASRIRVRFDGARTVKLDRRDGSVVVRTAHSAFKQAPPRVYQVQDDGSQWSLAAAYRLRSDQSVVVDVTDRDLARPVVIDPVLLLQAYFGGSADDFGVGMATDPAGNLYVASSTSSPDFPTTTGAYDQTPSSPSDLVITKLAPNGDTILYSTYLGGNGVDQAADIVVDENGAVAIAGTTTSTDFPVTAGASQSTPAGAGDAFLTRLAPNGASLLMSTYCGGTGTEAAYAVRYDHDGHVAIAGTTTSTNLPMAGFPFQPAAAGGGDAFFARYSLPVGTAPGGHLSYAAYLGGSGSDVAIGMAATQSGIMLVVGQTISTNFPTASPLQPAYGGGGSDGFAVAIPDGGLEFATYVGGSGNDVLTGVVVAPDGIAYVTGYTTSTDFPVTPGALQSTLAGGEDAIVASLGRAGREKRWAPYFGGTAHDRGRKVVGVGDGRVAVVGWTASADLPVTSSAPQPSFAGGIADGFVTTLNTAGVGVSFSTFLGGSGREFLVGAAAAGDHGLSLIP